MPSSHTAELDTEGMHTIHYPCVLSPLQCSVHILLSVNFLYILVVNLLLRLYGYVDSYEIIEKCQDALIED
jgi:hypothetical protein